MTVGSWLLVAIGLGCLLFLALWTRALMRNIRESKNHEYPRAAFTVGFYFPALAVLLLVLIVRTLVTD